MTRRRPTFPQYLRRRWRAVGLILVLLAGGLLVLAVTDRGHDPEWSARTSPVDQVVLSPDGAAVYALARDDANGTRLEARSAADGRLLWESPTTATRALLRAGRGEVAVATDFPRAFLTLYDPRGAILWQMPLEGSPRAMAVENGVVALSLQAAGNPVLVVQDGQVQRVLRFNALVDAVDLRAGRLAVGTEAGQLVAFAPDGARVANVSLPLSVRTLRLGAGATAVAIGGFDLAPGSLAGGVGVVDLGQNASLRWLRATRLGVGLVDVDADVRTVLALEAVPPHTAYAFDAQTNRTLWERRAGGVVSRDDAGAYGGAALSPDGSTAIVATHSGPVRAFDARTGALRWSYEAEGATVIAFARDLPDRFVASARLVQTGQYGDVLLFSSDAEPTAGRVGVVAAALTLLAAAAAAGVVGVGFWRARRSW